MFSPRRSESVLLNQIRCREDYSWLYINRRRNRVLQFQSEAKSEEGLTYSSNAEEKSTATVQCPELSLPHGFQSRASIVTIGRQIGWSLLHAILREAINCVPEAFGSARFPLTPPTHRRWLRLLQACAVADINYTSRLETSRGRLSGTQTSRNQLRLVYFIDKRQQTS